MSDIFPYSADQDAMAARIEDYASIGDTPADRPVTAPMERVARLELP